MANLPLNEQFQTIWRQARLIAISEEPPVLTIMLSEVTPSDLTLERYLSLQKFNKQVIESQQSNNVEDSAI